MEAGLNTLSQSSGKAKIDKQDRMLPAIPPKPQEANKKPRIFSISHSFTENWIRIQQIAKLIGRKK